VCLLHAVEAETDTAGALHLALTITNANCAATVWGAGAPLHKVIVLEIRLEQEAIKALGCIRVLLAKEAPHNALIADGKALHLHATNLLLATVYGCIEVLCPT
jgi:hypothetical protein